LGVPIGYNVFNIVGLVSFGETVSFGEFGGDVTGNNTLIGYMGTYHFVRHQGNFRISQEKIRHNLAPLAQPPRATKLWLTSN